LAISLTVNFTIPNGARLEFPNLSNFDDDTEIWRVRVELRTSSPNGRRLIAATELQIRNGPCHQLERQVAPPVGLTIGDVDNYFVVTSRNVATGYTDARAAERAAANTPAARRTALEAFLFTAGHIGTSLAGS
jgi:hypothetical protein